MKIRLGRVILAVITISIVLISIVVLIWLLTPYNATSDALNLLKSTDKYNYSDTGNLEFVPKEAKEKGLIFYPGGRVEAKAYSYICAGIASEGYPCVIAVMPFNLAVFKINAADEIINKYPNVKDWIISGHSLGGSMVARYVQNHPDKVSGIAFLASYSDVDLSNFSLPTGLINGDLDAILNTQAYSDNYKNFSGPRHIVVIPGGNHSQFGDYGLQEGDEKPTTAKEEQHQMVVDALLKMLVD